MAFATQQQRRPPLSSAGRPARRLLPRRCRARAPPAAAIFSAAGPAVQVGVRAVAALLGLGTAKAYTDYAEKATAAEKSLRDAAPKVVVDREAELVAVDGHSLRVKNDLALLGLHKWRLPERASAVERRARLPKLTPAQLAQFAALETSVGGCPVRRQSQSQWTACCGSLKLRYNEQHMTLHAEVGDPLAPAGQPLGAHELELAAKVEALIEALEPTA
mmetsp:Transcript_21447/g.66505  ORF Transcript_21447/g.66505 Transcript_21447/m.66505 type:complete len:218 (-) Transcript_21447:287-940(-)